jgi:hypothetical protein
MSIQPPPELRRSQSAARGRPIALRRLRAHGFTLFSRPRLRTRSLEAAEKSLWSYGHDAEAWGPEHEGWYSTSLLGMCNGIIRWSGVVFSFAVTKPDANYGRYILRTEMRRRKRRPSEGQG